MKNTKEYTLATSVVGYVLVSLDGEGRAGWLYSEIDQPSEIFNSPKDALDYAKKHLYVSDDRFVVGAIVV